jgi:hypothetical protein
MKTKHALAAVLAAALSMAAATGVQAGERLANGGFETGDFSGWAANVQAGSSGDLSVVANVNGNAPFSGIGYLANPGGGNFIALSDQTGPGSYSLVQAFTTTGGLTKISFDLFANNYDGAPIDGRDYTGDPVQNVLVDILKAGADPFTTNAADVIATLYGPGADDPATNPNAFNHYLTSLSLASGTYQIRFAETDNQSFFNMGVDNVSVLAGVPEPTAWAMMIVGLFGCGAMLRRRAASVIAA